MELALTLAAVLACAVILARGAGRAAAMLCVGVLALGLGVVRRPDAGDGGLEASLPEQVQHGGFVSSGACRACHPGEHSSWHDSFHRTMTQAATPDAVLGDFDGVTLVDRGVTTRLSRRGDELWVDTVDPLWWLQPAAARAGAAPRLTARVVMATGSHHLQTYWLRRPDAPGAYLRPDDGALLQMPWSWLVEEERWVPTQDTFLHPPSSEPLPGLPWNTSCNLCHSVGTRPRLARDRFATESVELGIACEACHGPGERHVRANRAPLRRYARHFADRGDPTIVNPARLDPRRAAEVCGQCHSFHKEIDMARWKESGVKYRAGDELAASKAVFRYTKNPSHPRLLEHLRAEPDALEGRFWKDGTMRVAGREYNGLIESKCFTNGALTCLSCHAMHGYRQPADQLAAGRDGDGACLQCHTGLAGATVRAAHTHHAAGSGGDSCLNCHMPHTTFGLLVAMRSHRIDSPNATTAARSGRPNACNLCHLDRTLGWTADRLSEWYGHARPRLTRDQERIAASVRWSAAGDAPQRAIAAWAMGWGPARRASGTTWQGAFLADSLADPYAVVRKVAYRSLRAIGGYSGFTFDYVAAPERLHAAAGRAVQIWQQVTRGAPDRHGPHLLMDTGGRLQVAEHERLLRSRDRRPVRIIE